MTPSRATVALQVLPPLLLLWPASTRHGPAILMLGGIFVIAAVFSLFRIAFLFLRPDRPHYKFYRPMLTLVICLIVFAHVQLSLRPARDFAKRTASEIQAQCDTHRQCPKTIPNWTPRHDRYSSQTVAGSWVRWPIWYYSDGKHFQVRLYLLLDSGEQWEGGVSKGRT